MVNRRVMVISVTGVAFVLSVLLAFAYTNATKAEEKVVVKESKILKKAINMQGMTCDGCEELITSVGSKIPGVTNISASSPKQLTIVEYNNSITDIDTIMTAIAKTGYKTLSAEDFNENHLPKVKEEIKKETKEIPSTVGEMKCGAGKCGSSME
ncbi:hypothetical protein GJV85_05275 [Sulfurimonas aquatica]|uniref:HMA domain-containing protein n=1 Tax=Sulfurimonas aquatica TaxID=2672570 RepID=A0A975GCE5_9BACT|nr:cation transporter [Sulfurimonas aquatica]QSZ41540.1 hypothetical protein GJV85_05275 [Sulfurimonas aquatica]